MRAKLLAGWLTILLLVATSLAAAGRDMQLVEAMKKQDKVAVRALLKERIDVNAPQGDGATALHWAAHWNDLETTDLLIRAGAAVNTANDLGATPLWVACTNSDSTAVVDRLLMAGADPNVALPLGESPLMTASQAGNADAVKLLLAHGANVNAKERSRGQTALMWAAAQQHRKVVKVLIENGADVNARADVKVMRVNTGSFLNNTISDYRSSSFYDVPGVVKIPQRGYTPLLFAAARGDLESARLLLGAGANINDIAPVGTSALVVAAHSGHGAFGAFLLDKGADPNTADAGYTALHAAILRRDVELVKALLAHGANPNTPVINGTPNRRGGGDYALGLRTIGATPLMLAAQFVEPDIMRILADNGADPYFVMKNGTTTLMAALRVRQGENHSGRAEDSVERSLEAVKVALDLGVDVNAADNVGDTALHLAASRRLNPVVQFLVDAGAKLNVRNKKGQTPLAMAGSSTNRFDTDSPTAKTGNSNSTADLLRKFNAKE